MIATGLALLLALAPAGAPLGQGHSQRRITALRPLTPENAARAKRGLLPRRGLAVRSVRSKRLYRPGSPTWLPEPVGPGAEVVVAEADADAADAPVSTPRFAAAIEGVELRWMVIRHRVRSASGEQP